MQRYGDASLVNHSTLALFSKLVCTPASTIPWEGQVGYIGGNFDNPAAQVVSCDSSGGKYVLGATTVRGTQITDATAGQSTTSNQWAVMLTLNRAGTVALSALTSNLYDAYASAGQGGDQNDVVLDTVAYVLDGNVSRQRGSRARSRAANSRSRRASPAPRHRCSPLNCRVVPCQRSS